MFMTWEWNILSPKRYKWDRDGIRKQFSREREREREREKLHGNRKELVREIVASNPDFLFWQLTKSGTESLGSKLQGWYRNVKRLV